MLRLMWALLGLLLAVTGGCRCGTSGSEGGPSAAAPSGARGDVPTGAVCLRRATCNDWRGCVLAVPAAGPIVQPCCEPANTGNGYREADSADPRATLVRSEVCPDGDSARRTCYESLDDGACGGPFLPRVPEYHCELRGSRCVRVEGTGD